MVADSTVMVAQDNLAVTAQNSHVEVRESVLARSLTGSLSFGVLAMVQAQLTSSPAGCGSLEQYEESLSASSSISGKDEGVQYIANATAVASGTGMEAAIDNLTIDAPFSGHLPGALNLQADVSIREVGGGGSVTLARHELHSLNIPVSIGSASSLCALSLSSLAAALSSSCNATLARAAFDSVLSSLAEEAAARGFALTAGWGQGSGCSAAYWVTLVELGVEGVTGSFDWTVLGSGTTA